MLDRFLLLLVACLFSAFGIVSIVRGRTFFGGPPALIIHRATKPASYWIIVGLSLFFSAILWLLFIADVSEALA